MSAKLYDLNDYRPKRKFLGMIGIAYESGSISLEDAIKFEEDYTDTVIDIIKGSKKGEITFIRPPLIDGLVSQVEFRGYVLSKKEWEDMPGIKDDD